MPVHSRSLGAAALTVLLLGQRVNATHPIINAYYPVPTGFSCSALQTAAASVESQIQEAMTNGSTYGKLDADLTAFSVDVYSLSNDTPFFTTHYLPEQLASQSASGVKTLDSNTIYRVGSFSKLLTTYLYLIQAGDSTWNRPLTDFVPELAAIVENNRAVGNSIDDVAWDTITVGALASHMAGIGGGDSYTPSLETMLEQMGLPNQGGYGHTTCGFEGMTAFPCNRTEFFEDFGTRHPTIGPFQTPAYSNAGYHLFGYVIENITGIPMEELLQQALVEPLGLNGTSYTVPSSEDNSIIPFNSTISMWAADLLDESPAGGYFSTINDLRAIGKSILNYTLISPAQTRRWMKPVTFTSNPNTAVGAPWEIYRAPGDLVSYMYTKGGAVGEYSAMFLLMPDLGLGFNILTAGASASAQSLTLTGIVANTFVPALWSEAAAETEATYSGTYEDVATNSTITVATISDYPGLVVSEWSLGGEDVIGLLGELMGSSLTMRLFPMNLEAAATNGTEVSWRAIWDTDDSSDYMASTYGCDWNALNIINYGGVGVDEFLFTLDSTRQAMSLESRITLTALPKINAAAKMVRRH